MIRQDEVFYIGKISKFRGICGETELLFTDDVFDRGEAPYLVIDMNGILVPFFWKEYRFKNNDTAIFKFEDINDEKAAKRLVGHSVFYPKKFNVEADTPDAHLSSWKAFTGFEVYDTRHGHLGTVDTVDDTTDNILIYLQTPDGTELVLPLHEDFIEHYSLTQRTITLALPEGLV